jgi:O-methyltransferase involved in polyketide biosynthesis
MSEKLTIELGNVQKTLLLPLWGRAMETQKSNPLLIDNTAVEVLNKIDFSRKDGSPDFSLMAKNISYLTQLAWVGRSILIDKAIINFLKKFPKATIVNIGCGLDTTFDRVDNGSVLWYDLDLPDVIELRKNFIQETERRKNIESSFLDYQWLDQLQIEQNILFIAVGVFYYFKETQIKDFLIKISGSFPGSEVIFDAASPFGVKAANKLVIKNSGMDENSFLKWGLEDIKYIKAWDSRINILGKYSLFKFMRKGLTFKKLLGTYVSDILKVMFMVHLKINGRQGAKTFNQ